MIWSLIPAELMQRAIACNTLGRQFEFSDDHCWTRDDALEVLKHIEGSRIGVGQGEVILIRNGEAEYAYGCEWYCKHNIKDEYPEYLTRSWNDATDYLNRFRGLAGGQTYVILDFINEYGFNCFRRDFWPRHFDDLGITRREVAPIENRVCEFFRRLIPYTFRKK